MCSTFLSSWRLLAPVTLSQTNGVPGKQGSGAPPLLCDGHGRAVPAGQEGQGPVGEGHAPAPGDGPDDEAEPFEGGDDLGGPGDRDGHQSGQVRQGDPGPVGNQVEGALLGGLEGGGQQIVGDLPPRTLDGEVGWDRDDLGLVLLGKEASLLYPVQDGAELDGGVDRGRTPHRVVRRRLDRLALEGEIEGNGGAGQRPADVPEPHVVGHQHEDRSGERPLAQPPHPVGKAGPVGGEPLPDDADGAAAGKLDGGVQGRGPVPPEPYGVCNAGDGGRQAVDRCEGVEPSHQVAPPLGGDGVGAYELVQGGLLLPGEPPQPGGGEVEPLGR